MAIRLRASIPLAYVMSNSLKNPRAPVSVSWMLTPRNTTSSPRCWRHAASRSRASARPGGRPPGRRATSGRRAPGPERPEREQGAQDHHEAADPDPADERADHHLDRRLALAERAEPGQDDVEVG